MVFDELDRILCCCEVEGGKGRESRICDIKFQPRPWCALTRTGLVRARLAGRQNGTPHFGDSPLGKREGERAMFIADLLGNYSWKISFDFPPIFHRFSLDPPLILP